MANKSLAIEKLRNAKYRMTNEYIMLPVGKKIDRTFPEADTETTCLIRLGER
jgi:hypothetical protein